MKDLSVGVVGIARLAALVATVAVGGAQGFESARMQIEVCLLPAVDASSAKGIATLCRVPEFDAMVRALGTRIDEAVGQMWELAALAHPGEIVVPWPSLSRLERLRILGDFEDLARPTSWFLFGLAPGNESAVDDLLAHVAASVRAAGGELQEDQPLPGTRRIASTTSDKYLIARQLELAVVSNNNEPKAWPETLDVLPPGLRLRGDFQGARISPEEGAQLLGVPGVGEIRFETHSDASGYALVYEIEGPREQMAQPSPPATAPRIPCPEAPLLAVRLSKDLTPFKKESLALIQGPGVHERNRSMIPVLERIDGSLSLLVAAPPRGGLVPRMAIALGLEPGADTTILDAVAEFARAAFGARGEFEEIDGLRVATLRSDALPAALRPTLALVDGSLWICDTPKTLRALRVAQKTEGVFDPFTDASATPSPVPDGTHCVGELWFDGEAIHRLVADTAGSTLVSMLLGASQDPRARVLPPVVERGALPETDDVAPLLGRGRGVLYSDANRIGGRIDAPVLGPLGCALLALGTSLVSSHAAVLLENEVRETRALVSNARAVRIGEAVVGYMQKNGGKRPTSLQDLKPLLPAWDQDPFVAPMALEYDSAKDPKAHALLMKMTSFQRPQRSFSAKAAWRGVPDSNRGRRAYSPDEKEQTVFAMSTAGYRDHHLVVTEDGEAIWIRSDDLLKGILPK